MKELETQRGGKASAVLIACSLFVSPIFVERLFQIGRVVVLDDIPPGDTTPTACSS